MPGYYDTETVGKSQFVGKAAFLREMTAQEFDDLKGRSGMSNALGPDTKLVYLQVLDLESPDDRLVERPIKLDSSSEVTQWNKFMRACREQGMRTRSREEMERWLQITPLIWEEGQETVKKFPNPLKYLKPVGIPSPEQMEAITAVAEPGAAQAPAPVRDESYLRNLILSTADGLTTDELMAELKGMGVTEEKEKVLKVAADLAAAGELVRRAGKFQVKEK